jgi:hypothetical protein
MLPADIRHALALTSPAAVYAGRSPRQVRQGTEVWLERMPVETASPFARLDRHSYRVHVRHGLPTMGTDHTGESALAEVEGHMATLVERYDGQLRTTTTSFLGRLSGLIAIHAEEEEVDEEPDEGAMLDGVVRVSFLVRS